MYKLPNKYDRPDIAQAYRENMFVYLSRSHPDVDQQLIRNFIDDQIKERFKDRDVTLLVQYEYGNYREEEVSILEFYRRYIDDVVAPCGNIYMEQHEVKSPVTGMLEEQLATRKAAKTAMLDFASRGDKANALNKHYEQATAKINMNSLPGGMASPYNLFYDKSGFNSITSFARSLIMVSYATTERLLASNFYLPDEEALINFLVTNLRDCPDKAEIDQVVAQFDLFVPNYMDVAEKFITIVEEYSQLKSRGPVTNFLQHLDQHEIIYLYYCQDLKSIIFKNEAKFKPLLQFMLNNSSFTADPTIAPDEFTKLDGDLKNLLTVVQSDTFEGTRAKDIPEKKPDLGRTLYAYGRYYQETLDSLQPLFDTFINVPTMIDSVHKQNRMYRKCVLLSDTDSVIFTAKEWVEWYTGNATACDKEALAISSVVIYWLTKVIEFTLNKLSARTGCQDDRRFIMKMKNEFLYPRMLVFPNKKTYAGIIMVQEGVILPELKVDLKGQQLKGSMLTKETLDKIQDLIINKVLKASMTGNLSTADLIEYVLDYEHKIKTSLDKSELDYLKSQSLKPEEHYKNPLSSNWFTVLAWNDIFGPKYGNVVPPCKTPLVSLTDIGVKYLDWLRDKDPDIYQRLKDFKSTYGKYPTALPISAMQTEIPEEIVPLVDHRYHVYANTNAMHKTLAALGVVVGFEKNKLLLSDIYG